ncbi:hypothetical protein BX661DRAFT_140501 [Kickxella alabastrina]|uniref:uncharacterized protein n=1 Tax=Kickxella alabastrina TaxID=61397 RepID=UPI00221F550C|nr:uncharacterized protein BX661DRAFT_140501 [Kickxella alabastrina]KAI7833460.1 hypothetical protein BX661DRAFT_140501 [Kickxella alabastrina]
MQLSKVDWRLHQTNNTGISTNGCLPVVTFNNAVVESGFWRIVQFMKAEGHDLNSKLNEEQLSQSTAYISLVQDCLIDSLLFSWYLVSENFADMVRPRLAKMFGFPLSLFIPTQFKDYAEERLQFRGISSDLDTAAEKEAAAAAGFNRHADKSAHPVYAQADKCLAVLSNKLGTDEYFFGASPTTLDAVVYGYLSLVLYPELPQSTLKTIVTSKYHNLVELCDRIHAQMEKPAIVSEQTWFSGIATVAKQSIAQYILPTVGSKQQQEEREDPQRAEKARSIVGALFVFIGYAIYNGVLSAPASN